MAEVLNPELHQPPKVLVTWEMLCPALMSRKIAEAGFPFMLKQLFVSI